VLEEPNQLKARLELMPGPRVGDRIRTGWDQVNRVAIRSFSNRGVREELIPRNNRVRGAHRVCESPFPFPRPYSADIVRIIVKNGIIEVENQTARDPPPETELIPGEKSAL